MTLLHTRHTKKNKIYLQELKQIVKSFRPTIIHSHLYYAEILVKHLQELNIPSFFHIHDNISQLERKKILAIKNKRDLTNLYEKYIYKTLLKKSNTTFLCISKNTLEYINKNLDYGTPILFPNAISTERFNSSKSKDINDINMITVGSLVQKKGHEFLIDVVHELKTITKRTINLKII